MNRKKKARFDDGTLDEEEDMTDRDLLRTFIQTQQRMMENYGKDNQLLHSDDPSLGGLGSGPLKGARDHLLTKKRIEEDGLQLGIEWWEEAQRAADHEEGLPFSAQIFGDRVLGPMFEGHATLHRMFRMQAAVHRYLWTGRNNAAPLPNY